MTDKFETPKYYETVDKPLIFMYKGKLHITWEHHAIEIDENNNAEYYTLIDQLPVPINGKDDFLEDIIQLDAVLWVNGNISQEQE